MGPNMTKTSLLGTQFLKTRVKKIQVWNPQVNPQAGETNPSRRYVIFKHTHAPVTEAYHSKYGLLFLFVFSCDFQFWKKIQLVVLPTFLYFLSLV